MQKPVQGLLSQPNCAQGVMLWDSHALRSLLDTLPYPKVLGNIITKIYCFNSSGMAVTKSCWMELLLDSLCPVWFPQEAYVVEMPQLGLCQMLPLRRRELEETVSPIIWAAGIASHYPFRRWKANFWTWWDDAGRKSAWGNYPAMSQQTKHNSSLFNLLAVRKQEGEGNSGDVTVASIPPSCHLTLNDSVRVAADFCWLM